MQAYCVKCKTKRDMVEPTAVYTKSGSPGTQGTCPECGTKMFRMGYTDAHEGLPKPDVTKAPKRKKKSKSKKKSASKKRRRTGKLVIVESPAKARSISSYLGKGYTVLASKGHVRDLLKTQLSVDVENDFEPKYRVPNDKRDVIKQIKSAVEGAKEVYLATDPDREGEAIAWHLKAAAEIPDEIAHRVEFHSITKDTVQKAFESPRTIDMSLVNAQQARRILDRLVGYKITELLWDKVRNYLSAGRVQSVALRMVVDRERDIESFNSVEYWTLEANLGKQAQNGNTQQSFTARLHKINGQDFELNSQDEVQPHVETLEKSQYLVSGIKKGTRQRKPSPPFTTSTLQQEASRRIGFSASRTMRAAQQLYEGIQLESGEVTGLITYMRTDSLNISKDAQEEARRFVKRDYGDEFVPKKATQYKTKAKGAQEAHEAIRPTSVYREPKALKSVLSRDQFRLYELIWLRFVASQMSNAVYDTMRVDVEAGPESNNRPYLFRATGSRIKFSGFLALYEDTRDEDDATESDEGRIFPELTEQELLQLLELLPEQHFTQPPPRYTEATLVRALEEYGIGRPSTYAPTVAVIQDRDYVTKEDKRLVPTDTGKIVRDMLVQYFPNEFEYEFTARMEGQLDSIAESDGIWQPMLHEFYQPFEQRLQHAREVMPSVKQEEKIGRSCPECDGGDLVIKYGRFGKFIGCSNYPDCRYTEQYVEYAGVSCPTCGQEHGGELVVKKTRKKGRTFYGCSRYPDCEYSAWKLPGKNDNDDEEEIKEEIELTG